MIEQSTLMIALGALFLTGLLADWIGHRSKLPRVTLLLGCGVLVGQSGLNWLPTALSDWYEFLSVVALTMVAFLLGNSLTTKNLRKNGRAIMAISIAIVIVTILIVALGLWLIGVPAPVALLLGAIATATDPAATQDAIVQSGVKGRFTKMLQAIVAIDDAWGLLAFSLCVVIAQSMGGDAHLGLLGEAAWEIAGAVGIGILIGVPATYLTGRLKKGQPMQSEALGIVFLTAGLSIWAGVSYLIAGMTVGTIVANFARHHGRPFHAIEDIQWPFMVLFFVLAGASLQVGILIEIGLIGIAFVVLRIVSRLIGGWIGGVLGATEEVYRPWFGPALLAQAGVAVGMALVAAREFPESADLILTLTIGTTVFFELLGPAVTLYAVKRVAFREGKL